MFKVRKDEPKYAFIPDVETPEKNRYGKAIKLVDESDPRAGQSLNINGDESVGDNPNRYKQHGFHFTADNCIGCHACEAACSEKNDLPAHISFRSVGYVEGGSYPAYKRMNISMACNHCDDPVCLKGCPTRAYTKYAEYGAVLQDPDTCFGCGYCTWVCPYNAPQLDPIKGQVSKCNMCVDRLEVGLKPACSSACLGGALEFGLIETIPENREQAKTTIPGFPDTSITHPNIRFQQVKSLPREMTRPDTMPIKYQRDEQGEGEYKTKVREQRRPRRWSLRKLLTSHENAHIAFTLCAQTVIGAFLLLLLAPMMGASSIANIHSDGTLLPLLGSLFILISVGMFKLNMHLGKPHRFYRGFNNLKHSPVSREIAGVSAFFAGFAGYYLFSLFDAGWATVLANMAAALALLGGLLGSYYMYKLYRIPARPYWNHWQTGTSFAGTSLSLGALVIGLVSVMVQGFTASATLIQLLALIALAGVLLEAVGLICHARDLKQKGGEGEASHLEQSFDYGNSYWLRNTLLLLNSIILGAIAVAGIELISASILLLSMLTASIIGRALFYVLVIPTTLPGAFFWRNKGFQEHARESGLAEMEQSGVLPRADYHDLHLARAIKEVKEDLGMGSSKSK